ncbi:MAG: CinA family protein [Methanomassiliicoccaceae archaeon]|nr:CinA family protein [Methanomassiliicoccaceae archaeon]
MWKGSERSPEGNELTLEEDLSRILSEKKITISVAESCTGGMLGSIITSVPGSSAYFLGGAVTYGYDSKEKLLGIKGSTLMNHGAVSENAAVEMAAGARELFGSDIAVSITGVAGPGGGAEAKPVGLVWFGISSMNGTFSEKFNFSGNRDEIRKNAADTAMRLLIDAAGSIR